MNPTHANGEAMIGQRTKATKAHSSTQVGLAEPRPRGTPNPQVSLGLDGKNGLLTSSLMASVLVGVLFAALTVGPYLSNLAAKSQPAAAKPGDPPVTEKVEPVAATEPTSKKPADPSKPPAGSKSDIVGKLGENVAKPASPSTNPLDKKDDDILKDLNK